MKWRGEERRGGNRRGWGEIEKESSKLGFSSVQFVLSPKKGRGRGGRREIG